MALFVAVSMILTFMGPSWGIGMEACIRIV